jgi:hypothetical protein
VSLMFQRGYVPLKNWQHSSMTCLHRVRSNISISKEVSSFRWLGDYICITVKIIVPFQTSNQNKIEVLMITNIHIVIFVVFLVTVGLPLHFQ